MAAGAGSGRRGLAGVTVVVTRPASQAAALIALLEAEGAVPVPVPLIDIVDAPPDVVAELSSELRALGSDDWVVVASPNGATHVAPLLDGVRARVAAVGATTAATLGRVDLRPARQSAEGLVAEIPAAPAGGRAVVVQSADGASTLVDGLRARGWDVRRIDTHRAVPVRPTQRQQFDALRSDAVILTSGSQATAWVATFGTSAPAIVVAIGPQTAGVAEAAGLKVNVVAADHSLAGSVSALVELFQR